MPKNKPIKCPHCGRKQAFPSISPNKILLNRNQLNKKWYFCGKCMSYFQEEAI